VSGPADRQSLAPVDVREHTGWTRLIQGVFQQKNVNTVAEARGVAPLALLTLARSERYNQRVGATGAKMGTRSRGSMADVPTPQALIRQVTGIGDPAQGR